MLTPIKTTPLLVEGLSTVVYHFTAVQNILAIIEQDKLIASSAMANVADGGTANRNKHFYVSFQRSRSAKIGFAGNTGGSGACIEFDGQALNTKYKGTAIDYWQRGKDPKKLGKDGVMSSNELEDRLVIDSPYIPNIRKYIKGIHVTVYTEGMGREPYEKLEKYCKRLSIPVYFYATTEDFKIGRPDRAQPLTNIEIKERDFPIETKTEKNLEDAGFYLKNITPLFCYQSPENIVALKTLFAPNDNDPSISALFDDNAIKELEYRYLHKQYGEYNQYNIKELKNNIYNETSNIRTSKNPYILEFSKLLSKELRLYGANNVVQWVHNKLEKIDNQEKQTKKDEVNKEFTEIIAVWLKATSNGYEDASQDPVDGYTYPDVLLSTLFPEFIQKKAARTELQNVIDNNWNAFQIKDLFNLLSKYMEIQSIKNFFETLDMRCITRHEKKMSQTQGKYIYLNESHTKRLSHLSKFVKTFLAENILR